MPRTPHPVLLAATLAVSFPALAALPAFPGADGAGAFTTGGRGGVVYHVTRLDTSISDTGPGTLHYGVTDANFKDPAGNVIPRTIVFDVGGTIWLGRNPADTEGWDTTNSLSVGSNVTLAGQTAPGGITIAGGQIKINGTGGATPNANVIFRNVTLAPGYGTRKANSASGYYDLYTYDAMDVNSRNVIVDHVSAFFATDETISANELADNATIQYSSMSQGQNYPQADAQGGGAYKGHAMGSLWSPGSNSHTSLLHNLYANQATRLPTLQTVSSKLSTDSTGHYIPPYVDVRNNVVYNWLGNAGYGSSGEPANANLVNNYYKVGPGGDSTTGNATDPSITTAAGGTSVFSGSASTQVYQSGNVRANLNGTTTSLTNSNFGPSAFQPAPNSVPYYGPAESALDAYNQVLNYAGANWQSRSPIDTRIINEVRTGTGKITALDDATHGYNSSGTYVTTGPDTEWNTLLSHRATTNGGTGATGPTYTRPANFDSDNDGMPDTWERAHGLNPSVPDNNGDFDNSGYTNLEHYLNDLAAFPAPTPLLFNNASGTSRYAEIGNWSTGNYQPSRFDQVQVNAGTATVDAPGQHAGTLTISSGATLSLTAGWLDIAKSLSANSAHITQSAGLLHAASSITLDPSSSYSLTGGTLATPLLSASPGAAFSFTGGTLHADTITFDLTVAGGTLAPGSDPDLRLLAAASFPDLDGLVSPVLPDIGTTHLTANLTLSSGTVQIDLASPTLSDTLTIDQTLTLGGALDVRLADGFTPHDGDRWLIATAPTIQGSFSSLPPGFTTETAGPNLYLIATPEPTLLLPALLLATVRPHRRLRADSPS